MKALQETVLSLTVLFEEVPRVPAANRSQIELVAEGIWHVTWRFGFMEVPNVPAALALVKEQGCPLHLDDAIYLAAARDEVIRDKGHPRPSNWRQMLFGVMYRNAIRAPDRFDLPDDKFLEIGRPIAV